MILPDEGESLVAVSRAPGNGKAPRPGPLQAPAATERSLARVKSELKIYG